ncbi:MAG: rhodanese-like domain-containing protein [Gammaproteobacteria bacterium TMED1]|jgi:rhodanese-related sulfurtransferase|nr:MAG: rhodanese-like domain-containing protein [Gammaproteobacteria bacterium TMED1]|tara:strand:- start:2153 stop:2569 length:417 start_codon:yes stop_codon:yes gene_type:complete
MGQFFEFIGNHYILVVVFVALLFAFFINEGNQGGPKISTTSLVTLVNRDSALVIDVRETKDFNLGHIAGALNIPYASVDARLGELVSYKDRPLVLVCKMGQHSGTVGKKLKSSGFQDIRRLSGGMSEWSASNLPIVKS